MDKLIVRVVRSKETGQPSIWEFWTNDKIVNDPITIHFGLKGTHPTATVHGEADTVYDLYAEGEYGHKQTEKGQERG